jgi:hypothetical protein
MLELGVFAFIQFGGDFVKSVKILRWNTFRLTDADLLPIVPLQMAYKVESFGWIMLLFLQAIFVIRGLTCCFEPGQHYVNCLLLKIRFSFCLLCLVLTLTISAFACLFHYKNILILCVPIGLFIALKFVV